MLDTVWAAEDGITPKRYTKGRRYNIADHILQSFISMGVIKIDSTYDASDYPDYETKVIKKKGRKER